MEVNMVKADWGKLKRGKMIYDKTKIPINSLFTKESKKEQLS